MNNLDSSGGINRKLTIPRKGLVCGDGNDKSALVATIFFNFDKDENMGDIEQGASKNGVPSLSIRKGFTKLSQKP